MAEGNLDDLRARTKDAQRKLSFSPDDETIATAKGLVEELRNARDFPDDGAAGRGRQPH